MSKTKCLKANLPGNHEASNLFLVNSFCTQIKASCARIDPSSPPPRRPPAACCLCSRPRQSSPLAGEVETGRRIKKGTARKRKNICLLVYRYLQSSLLFKNHSKNYHLEPFTVLQKERQLDILLSAPKNEKGRARGNRGPRIISTSPTRLPSCHCHSQCDHTNLSHVLLRQLSLNIYLRRNLFHTDA